MDKKTKTLLSLVMVFFIVIYTPLISLWTINSLFHVNIQYTFWTWLAMSWIHLIIFISRPVSTSTTIIYDKNIKDIYDKLDVKK